AHLGRERIAEVLGLEDLADLDLAFFVMRIRTALHPLDRLVPRLHLPDPEARDELFRFGERSVDDRPLAAGKSHPRAFRPRVQPLAGDEHAGLGQFLVEFAHRGKKLAARHNARLGILAGFDQDHESQCRLRHFSFYRVVVWWSAESTAGCISQIGRTSTLPKRADGQPAAVWIASFKSRASIREYPPSCSLVSANGPSVATTLPS